MNRLVTIVGLAIFLVGLFLLGLSDTRISIADTGIPDNELTASQTEASNSSATAPIIVTMYAADDEQPSHWIWKVVK